MEMTLRWYGTGHDTVTLKQIRQIPGVTGVITTLYDTVPGEAWKMEDILALKKEVEDAGLKVENLVVRDLIDVTLTGEFKDHLATEGNTITITFKLGIGAGQFLTVLHNYEADKWEMIASDRVKIHENGDVSVSFDSLSPVAFVVDKAEHGVTAEPEATPWVMYALIAAAVVVVVVIIVLVAARKKKPTEAAKTE